MSSKGLKKVDPNYSPNGTNFDNFLDHFWGTFGVHFGAKIGSRRGPKVEPLLEPLGAASQGSASCFSRNSTRGVERLLELQLYSPKEREVSAQALARCFFENMDPGLPIQASPFFSVFPSLFWPAFSLPFPCFPRRAFGTLARVGHSVL